MAYYQNLEHRKPWGSLDHLEDQEQTEEFQVLPHSIMVKDSLEFLHSRAEPLSALTDYQTRSASYMVHSVEFHSSSM